MNLEEEFNSLIPDEFGGEMNNELLEGCIKICKLSNLKAIQTYLLEHGSNDESINNKIRNFNIQG
ncbi:hypothetical protein [uncultured Flavobacterium sp.]|uniref:hypothetical protein n=1 Tax=uncultured Flavobacterium sp. TaxID=165435 RepID=UPI0030EEB5F5|tara:strand:+ start:21124 stop:21318 length:195 start_codon:yes stop_codon:yes gene_type:complete